MAMPQTGDMVASQGQSQMAGKGMKTAGLMSGMSKKRSIGKSHSASGMTSKFRRPKAPKSQD